MGMLVDGQWVDENEAKNKTDKSGAFKRTESGFRNWVTTDGSAGPTGEGGFVPDRDRYHLYVAMNCPWAHRTLLMRAFKGLEDTITLDKTVPGRTDQGWYFNDLYVDNVLGKSALHQVYTEADTNCTGRVTVPVLWDRERETIVSNESSEIIRMMNDGFAAFSNNDHDMYPEDLRSEIDAWNDLIYNTINNGVYRSGFSTSQNAYDEAVREVFKTLDTLEARLSDNRYLCGDRFTEADVRLFPTMIRFDVAYFGAFKCNIRRLIDYPNLWAYTREIYQMPGISETVDLDIYKRGYYSKSPLRNPTGIVPLGPDIDPGIPHGRG
ncbi:MAG: glutathione S-transferase family protein [Alphaproteobacteria bacterium]|nr:glutathione S-transferase family protein [Alphaproteobacteria bacterium]